MSLQLFFRVSPRIFTPLFYGGVFAQMIYRFFFGSIAGALLLSLALWFFAPSLFGVHPLSASGLLLFISELPDAFKIAVTTSVLTIAGFLVSFHISTANWREKLRVELQQSAAGEIEVFFHEVAALTNKLTFAAESALEIVRDLRSVPPPPNTQLRLEIWLGELPKTIDARAQLSKLTVDVHRLTGKYYNLLASNWGALPTLERAVAAVGRIGSAMWIFWPSVAPDDPNASLRVQQSVDIEAYQKFIDTCERESGVIAGLTGGLRGQLLAPVIGFTASSAVGLFTQRKKFRAALDALYEAQRT